VAEFNYRALFEEVTEQLQRLQGVKTLYEDKLDEVNGKIEALTKTYNAIAPIVGEPPIADLPLPMSMEDLKAAGLTAQVRWLLNANRSLGWLTAAMVRDLMAKAFDLGSYTNPLATVNTTLVRLVASGFAEADNKADGTKRFRVKRTATDLEQERRARAQAASGTTGVRPTSKE
jgi:hypothetical protein